MTAAQSLQPGHKEHILHNLAAFALRGGPLRSEYRELDDLIEGLAELHDENELTAGDVAELHRFCAFMNDPKTLVGHSRAKPLGYAGDYQIIDRLYQWQVSEGPHARWDHYVLESPAARAVRNRKAYFKNMVHDATARHGGQLRLLDVASGPARDLLEVYIELSPDQNMRTTCVEMDPRAIQYAKAVTALFGENIEFCRANALRYRTQSRFELIWSAGLFDYFNEKTFVRTLQRLLSFLAPGGELVVGNFNAEKNPTRNLMELWGKWNLEHRSAQQLMALAARAGCSPKEVWVAREPEGINLFLHVRPGAPA